MKVTYWGLDLLSPSLFQGGRLQGVTPAVLTPRSLCCTEVAPLPRLEEPEGPEGLWRWGKASQYAFTAGMAAGKAARKPSVEAGSKAQHPACSQALFPLGRGPTGITV